LSEIYNIPSIAIFTETADDIINSLVKFFETAARADGVEDWRLQPSDFRRKALESWGYYTFLQQQRTNKAFLMEFLPNATGAFLDALGALWGPMGRRLEATPAKTTMRFTMSIAQTSTVVIPAGMTTSPGNNIFFRTEDDVIIYPGDMTAEVVSFCTQPGAQGNGFLPGQISIINDWNLPFASTAENITPSAGGAGKEEDDPYRERLYVSWEALAVTGPVLSYVAHTLRVSPDIVDVDVWSPEFDAVFMVKFLTQLFAAVGATVTVDEKMAEQWWDTLAHLFRESGTGPGNVNVVPFTSNGIVSDELIEDIEEALSPVNVRPLSDYVHVLKPTEEYYDIEARWWLNRSELAMANTIEAAVKRSVQDYIIWQRRSRIINPSELTKRMRNAGAGRCEVDLPVYQKMSLGRIAMPIRVSVLLAGIDDL